METKGLINLSLFDIDHFLDVNHKFFSNKLEFMAKIITLLSYMGKPLLKLVGAWKTQEKKLTPYL